MHEASLIAEIIKTVEVVARDNGLTSIKEIRMQIGELRRIDPVGFRFIFDTMKKGSMAKDALLKVKYIPVSMLCEECGREFVVKESSFRCPHCGSEELRLEGGREFLLESIEGD